MCRSPSARTVDVDQRVARELLEHVVEETDAGRNVVRAGAVEVDRTVIRFRWSCGRFRRYAWEAPSGGAEVADSASGVKMGLVAASCSRQPAGRHTLPVAGRVAELTSEAR